MEVGLYHDPEEYPDYVDPNKQLTFYVMIDNATYTADYIEGLELMRQLSSYNSRIKELRANN